MLQLFEVYEHIQQRSGKIKLLLQITVVEVRLIRNSISIV